MQRYPSFSLHWQADDRLCALRDILRKFCFSAVRDGDLLHHMQAEDVRSIFAGLGGIHSRQHSRWVAAAVIGHCQVKAVSRRFGAHGNAHRGWIVADAVVQ